jgi:hypothetical protein
MTFANFKIACFVISVLGLQILISRHRISKINLLFVLVHWCDIRAYYGNCTPAVFFKISASHSFVSSSFLRGEDPVRNPTVVFLGTVGLEPWNELFTYSNLNVVHSVVFYTMVYQQKGARSGAVVEHCATNQKVLGSISDGVIGIFELHNLSGRTMAL